MCQNKECPVRKIAIIRAGGQTGADRGGLDAARECGVPIVGWCPANGLAEDLTSALGLLTSYPELVETESAGYIERTGLNVRDSHATLIVAPDGLEPNSGTAMTVDFAHEYKRPVLVVRGAEELPAVESWLSSLGDGITLNIAGPRSSKCPRAYGETKTLVVQLLNIQVPDCRGLGDRAV